MDGLVGVIKARVQEHGGKLVPANAARETRRMQRERTFLADREAMMTYRGWIEGAVYASIKSALGEVVLLADQANAEHGFEITAGAQDRSCVLRSDFVSLSVVFEQPIFNRVSDHMQYECYLRASEFSGMVLLPGERAWVMHQPREFKRHKLKADVSETRALVWREGSGKTVIPADQLGDYQFRIFLGLLGRANRGQIGRPEF
ncbi:hypothetical protein [Bradyrhizobium sp. SZCCHNS2005]|uniref:hypothetical protein n=1 Tax=Bradyrhizobium sp. SZCCHNS2005 TaxID=3057303 RepID=UPI0028EF2B29|nr:hypothetical protein [Bradyrhizobium sp. SZCCHNS2005]